MKTIEIKGTKHHGVVLIDDADYHIVRDYHWTLLPRSDNKGYYAICYKANGNIFMHRLLLNPKSDEMIDHKNGNGLDNRRSNIRICTGTQNQGNSGKRTYNGTTTTSKYKGVWRRPSGKWAAECAKKRCGTFTSEYDAAIAYDKAAVAHFGDFAVLNFPKKMPLSGLSFPKGTVLDEA